MLYYESSLHVVLLFSTDFYDYEKNIQLIDMATLLNITQNLPKRDIQLISLENN